jgi:glutathione S-transferase
MPTPASAKFVLRTSLTSPFGRKVRIAAEVLGLTNRIKIELADTQNEHDTLRRQNPLGKMPCLLLEDGSAIYDSRVIIEFLQEIAGSNQLIPANGHARYHALTRATLADGIADAALLIVYETRYRPPMPPEHSERWLKHQHGKIARALADFERAPPNSAHTDIVSISLSCALGYLDWRKPVEWRPHHPNIVAWLGKFTEHTPSYARSRPEDVKK